MWRSNWGYGRGMRFALSAFVLATVACGSETKTDEPGSKPSVGSKVRDAAPVSAPKPPSTGNEAPRTQQTQLSAERANKAMIAARDEMKSGSPNCNRVVRLLTLAIPVVAPEVNEQTVPAYRALQHCARKTKRWQTLLRASVALLPAGVKVAEPETVVRALVELGEYDKARAAIRQLGKTMPDARTGLAAARTLLACKQQQFKKCLAAAQQALAFTKKTDPELRGKDALRNRMLRALAFVNLGEFSAARGEFKAMGDLIGKAPPPVVVALNKAMTKAELHQLFVDYSVPPNVPLGIYHLMGSESTGFVAKVALVNLRKRPRQLKVELEINGLTTKIVKSVTLLAGKKRHVMLLVPPLKIGFDISTVRSEKPAQVSIKITEKTQQGETVVMEESSPVKLLPRDYLPTYRKIGADATRMTPQNIAAWVTPNAKPIDTFLAAAKKRHPNGSFVGQQGPTIPQVKALFDELKSRGVTYVMDPTVNTDLVAVQRTRLPTEVLASTNAQCLEGTILFATLMEAIGLEAIIVLVPGHAFVGWETVRSDGRNGGQPMFVETTMVGNASFEQAVKVASQRVAAEVKAGNHKKGVTHLLRLRDLRAAGFKPQPM